MSYTALYRKWRPLVFEDVVEQEHVVRTIKNTVKSERIGHAYLFCGTRGTGKTTMAKIFARAINCLNTKDGDPCNECEICKGILNDSILDVVEIDAASNNSVDNIREIRDEVVYAPSQARYKVYIIDEVHMLSAGAFNALLKTLEEPPAHVVFILATTDPHKLPATILSRCQRFDFKKITPGSIAERVKVVAGASGISLEDDAALLIARLADGAMRDALSILDQCISVGNKDITHQDVLNVIGIVSDDFISEIVDYIKDTNVEGLVNGVERLSSNGRDILRFASDLVMYFRNLLLCKITDNPAGIIDVSSQYLDNMMQQSEAFTRERIISIIKELSAFESQLKYALNQRVFLEVMLISISVGNYGQGEGNNALADRITDLENAIRSGAGAAQPRSGSDAAPAAGFAAQGRTSEKVLDRMPPVPDGGGVQNPFAPPSAAGSKASGGSTASAAGTGGNNLAAHQPLEVWPEVMTELKASGRMMLVTYLASTRAVAGDESTILVVFPEGVGSFKNVVAKPEYVEVLYNVLQKKLGRQVRIKFIDEEELGNIVPGPVSEKSEEQESTLLKNAREIAGKLNVHLDIIDE
ncbi:DNA polymerase III subunit gamma/tau [Ruminiclostridium cellobioparum]|jgi:DNA polymerase-3 subunit gamma/tau|uniref:DNA polymerase III subunit gamma/tau n=1 Tax=Ruminiclostridium cellobioparum TaxID=29355 RepID=UPI00048A0136|nr:DNA polymerase III subunit gamma/tau [Ruminiclostridium cellobioparum]